MNACVVFAGPSLPRPARPAAAGVTWYPPARRGDLAALDLPRGSTVALQVGQVTQHVSCQEDAIVPKWTAVT
jgi:hypothetical protein